MDRGGHPNAVKAEWVYCRVCELIEIQQKQGPPPSINGEPAPGWHIGLTLNPVGGGDG